MIHIPDRIIRNIRAVLIVMPAFVAADKLVGCGWASLATVFVVVGRGFVVLVDMTNIEPVDNTGAVVVLERSCNRLKQ